MVKIGPTPVQTRQELRAALEKSPKRGPVAFVPTMGALHPGHASLMARAREEVGPAGQVVVSIFVNPLQFAPGEDFERYPRTLDDDLAVCAQQGVDLVFFPEVEDVYPNGVPHAEDDPSVTVDPGPLASQLEGASRPGHFRGVLTVVAKLFGLVRPETAIFGQKDYQQLVLIRRMAADLCLGISIVAAETLRDPDGLALSSRNRYLDADQRTVALSLSRALRAAQERASSGLAAAREAAMAELSAQPGLDLDYLSFRAEHLDILPDNPEPGTVGRVLVAAKVGTTRLIDNAEVILGG